MMSYSDIKPGRRQGWWTADLKRRFGLGRNSVREDRSVLGRVRGPAFLAGYLEDADPVMRRPRALTAPDVAEIDVVRLLTAMTRPPGPPVTTIVSSLAHSIEAASPARSTAVAIGVAVSPTAINNSSARSSKIETAWNSTTTMGWCPPVVAVTSVLPVATAATRPRDGCRPSKNASGAAVGAANTEPAFPAAV